MTEQQRPVLVIDDHPDTLEGLGALLRQEGFAVSLARNGLEALSMLRDGLRPCIIVMDLMMPVMNGFEFREEQLRDPALADIPVIACSGVTDPVQTAGHLGAKALLHKPTQSEQLIALIWRHCLRPDNPPAARTVLD